MPLPVGTPGSTSRCSNKFCALAGKTSDKQHHLTGRELIVLDMVMQEKTNQHIAQALGISERTVSDDLSAIYEKLGVVSKVGAALKAERLGLIED